MYSASGLPPFLFPQLLWSVSSSLHASFFVVFLVIVFIDGIGVSFSNVADIDSGGVNLIAAQYGIEIDDNIRNYFTSLHILFFDLSMVVFNPLLAYIGVTIGERSLESQVGHVGHVVDELSLIIAIGGVFLISTLVTLIAYNWYMPTLVPVPPGFNEEYYGHNIQSDSMVSSMSNLSLEPSHSSLNSVNPPPPLEVMAEPDPISWSTFKLLANAVREGAALTWANKRIRYRVLFFTIETSIEDAMIALIAAQIGSQVFVDSDIKLRYAWGNLWGAGLVACGKSGGVIASVLMHRYFTIDPYAPDPNSSYRPLFWFAFLGGLSALALPIIYHFRLSGDLGDVASTLLIFVSMFLFFLFSTISKIGFSTLMQSMAAEVESTAKVFGFLAAFVTATDAIILMGLSAIYATVGFEKALWISCGLIATHGLFELVLGPRLVLKKPPPPSLDEQLRQDLAQPFM